MKNSRLLKYVFLIAAGIPLTTMAETKNPGCEVATTNQVVQLFNRWNAALQTGNPKEVVALYAENAILLPTISNTPRATHQEIENYFNHFLTKHPYGKIESQVIRSGCNWATDTGLYTFTFYNKDQKKQDTVEARFSFTYEYMNKNWLIVSHHSSLLPNAPDSKENLEEMLQLEQTQK